MKLLRLWAFATMKPAVREVLAFNVFLCLVNLFCDAIEVETPLGKIIGSDHLRTRHGKAIYSFKGVPYGQPPVGNLRFKESQPVKPWAEPFDATKNGPDCPQVELSTYLTKCHKTLGQEDCLRLNIYSPNVDPAAKLAVMVFIHGGSAYSTKGNGSSPEFILDKDVILVDLNYRLGALGFMTTGDEIIPANLGMKDQVLALKWVRDNIANFGGDPERITIFGQSSGGTCAQFHLVSPLSKGLIQRGISMSGTSASPWSVISMQLAKDRTKAMSVLCGCPIEPAQKLLECMQTIPIEVIIEMQGKFQVCMSDEFLVPTVTFAPVIEPASAKNAFLTPDFVSRSDPKVPWITGVTSAEGLFFASRLLSAKQRKITNLKQHLLYILPRSSLLDLRIFGDDQVKIFRQISHFYLGDEPVSKNNIHKVVDMFTDGWYLTRAVRSASNYKGDSYLYYYDYLGSVSFSSVIQTDDLKGVCDADDTLNLFPQNQTFPNRAWTETDLKVSETMLDLWTNFAKSGKPTTNTSMKWEPMEKNPIKYNYLDITPDGQFTQKTDFLPDRVDFWTGLFKEHGLYKNEE